MNRIIASLSCAAILACVVASAHGQVIFQSDFTVDDGFMDGTIGFGPDNPDAIVGQGGYMVDTSGTGTLTNTNGSAFLRAVFGLSFGHTPEFPDPFDQALVDGLVAGDVIEIEATGMQWPGNGSGANLGVFGMARINGNNILGGSQMAAGVQFTTDMVNVFIDTDTAFSPNLEIDTGIALGTEFDYLLRFVSQGAGLFDIEHHLNDDLLATVEDFDIDFMPIDFNSEDTGGFIQDFGGGGLHSVDSLRLEVIKPIVIEEGDFDADGDVDGADFLRWQQDGLSPADLQAWQTKYGFGAMPPPVSAASAVPEPNTIAIGLLGLALGGSVFRKRG